MNAKPFSTAQLKKQGFSDRSIKEYKDWIKKPKPKKQPKKKVEKPLSRHQKAYLKYLESEHWAQIKLDLYAVRGFQCEVCFSTRSIQVHHKTYERIGREEPQDVILLCRPCHKKAHGLI